MPAKRRKLSHVGAGDEGGARPDLSHGHPEVVDHAEKTKDATKSSRARVTLDASVEASLCDACPICLQEILDLALTYPCNHPYDYVCLLRWVDISPTCPLCKTPLEFIIYSIDGQRHKKHHLNPGAKPMAGLRSVGEMRRQRRQVEQERRFQRRSTNRTEFSEQSLEEQENQVALQRRRFVYSEHLMASHVGTNRHSNFAAFSLHDLRENRRNLKSKMTMFLRRELQVFDFLTDNREFTLHYLVDGVLSQLEMQSAGATKLVGDLLGEENAKVLLHELRTFLRSPFEGLRAFDHSTLVQYARDLQPPWPSGDSCC